VVATAQRARESKRRRDGARRGVTHEDDVIAAALQCDLGYVVAELE
jgi:hypothetical protein